MIGPRTEIEYVLRNKYGIPTGDIPLTSSGSIKTNYLSTWVKFQKAIDDHLKLNIISGVTSSVEESRTSVGIECPDFHYIVFRRNYSVGNMILDMKHAPNKVFCTILSNHESEYSTVPNDYKVQVIEQIIQEAQQMNFRFVTWDKSYGWYVELCATDDGGSNTSKNDGERKQLRDCVVRAMKDNMKRSKARSNQQVNGNSNREGLFQGQDGKKRKTEKGACGGCFTAVA